VKQIHAALHPEFGSLLNRQEDQLELRPVGCAPADHRSPEILVSGKVMAFLRLVEKAGAAFGLVACHRSIAWRGDEPCQRASGVDH
jgi:hypothetical protein